MPSRIRREGCAIRPSGTSDSIPGFKKAFSASVRQQCFHHGVIRSNEGVKQKVSLKDFFISCLSKKLTETRAAQTMHTFLSNANAGCAPQCRSPARNPPSS
jgi:hypothetical protein